MMKNMIRGSVFAGLGAILLSAESSALDHAWLRDADASWQTATNWSSGSVPNAAGEVAWLTNNISANRGVALDGAVMLGGLVLGDANNSHVFTVSNGLAGSTLTFEDPGAVARISETGSLADTLSSPIYARDDLVFSVGGTLLIPSVITESNGTFGLSKTGPGILALFGSNIWNGTTTISNGVLRVGRTTNLPNGNLEIQAGVLEFDSNDFIRVAGSGAGEGRITAGASGFSVFGGANRTARFNAGGSSLSWGSAFFNPSALILNYSNANRQITWDNAIDLNGGVREFITHANVAVISRNITNSTGSGSGFIKSGAATLQLGGSNRWEGATIVSGGALRVAGLASLPSNNVVLNNGVLEFQILTPDQNRGLGTGDGQIQLAGSSGLGAHNGIRTINVGGATQTLVWGAGDLANLNALVLNGTNSGGTVVIANPVDLNGAIRTVTVSSAVGVLAGVTNSVGTAGIVKHGGGTLIVQSDNTQGGSMSVAGGTVQLGDFWHKSGALPVTGGNAGDLASSGGTLLLANPGDSSVTTLLSGVISGTITVTKNDRQTLQFTGANTYTGNNTINRGTLLLDFGAATANTNILAPSTLILGNSNFDGGTLVVRSEASGGNREIFRGVTLNPGASAIVADSSAGAELTIVLSNITRNAGGVLDFTPPAAGAILTTTTNAPGILGGYATLAGTEWAAYNPAGGNIVAYTGHVVVAAGSIAEGPDSNVKIAGGVGVAGPTTTVNSVMTTNDGNAYTVTLAGSALRLGTRGGVFAPAGSGGLAIGAATGDGVLTAGRSANTAGELIFINHSTNPITVNAAIASNGSQAVSLTKAGGGPAVFSGNVNSGGTHFYLAGEARYTGTNVLGGVNVLGGHLVFDTTSSNTLIGTATANGGSITVNGPVTTTSGLDIGSVLGGRAVLRVAANLTASRVRGGANDNMRTASAIFQSGGIVFSASDSSGTTISDGLANSGYYQLSGGSITGNMVGTFRGYTVFDQTGGSVWPSNQFQIVNNSGIAVFNIFGGTLNAPSTTAALTMVGTAGGDGTAVINVLGGVVQSALNSTGKSLDLMPLARNNVFLNLVSGTLTANQVKATSAAGTSVFNFNGGELAVAGGTTLGSAFMSGLSSAYIHAGGAVVNVNTNSVTIGQALLAPTGHGLAQVATNEFCGGGYIGAPVVQITGGAGLGAQAIAEMDFTAGVITNFRVTNPGSGYLPSDTLTVTLLGGGALQPATPFALGAGSLAASTGGGLLKLGRSTLTLTNANTYEGPTTIQTGLLVATHASALGSTGSPTIINSTAATTNGGQLQVGGNITLPEDITVVGVGDGGPNFTRAIDGASGTNSIAGVITLNSNRSYRIGVGSGTATLNLGLIQRADSFSGTLIVDPVAGGRVNIGSAVDNNAGQLTCHGGGIVTLSAPGNDVGLTAIQNSTTLRLQADNALPTNQSVQMGHATQANGASGAGNDRAFLFLEGVSQTVNSLNAWSNSAGNATINTNRKISSTSAGEMTLSVGSANGGGYFDGIIENGTGGGTLALTKLGTNVQTLAAPSTFTGPARVGAGTLALAAEGALASTSIVVAAGATLSVTGRVDGTLILAAGQTLSGDGTVQGIVVNLGTVAPGASAGTLTVSGDYTDAGSLHIELESAASYDVLNVGGSASLAGVLNVSLLDNYTPTNGDTFVVLQSSGLAGAFTATNLPAIPGIGWNVQYLANVVVLSVTGYPTGYLGYSLQVTNASQRGIADDPDGDGFANLLEYVTGANPTNSDQAARMNAARTTNGIFALRFTRNTNSLDATLIVEGAYAATNDAAWAEVAVNTNGVWSGAAVTETGASNPVGVTVEDTDPTATNRFLRLRVTKP